MAVCALDDRIDEVFGDVIYCGGERSFGCGVVVVEHVYRDEMRDIVLEEKFEQCDCNVRVVYELVNGIIAFSKLLYFFILMMCYKLCVSYRCTENECSSWDLSIGLATAVCVEGVKGGLLMLVVELV